MHQYLAAIGFKHTLHSERELELLLDNLYHTGDERIAVREDEGRAYLEIVKRFGPHIGIRLYGEMDAHGFHRTYYFPYFEGTGITSSEELSVEMQADGHGYLAMLDDGRIGVSLIYYLLNQGQYHKAYPLGVMDETHPATTLSALSSGGAILLPIDGKDELKQQAEERDEYYRRHDALVLAARNGSEEAMESLTLEDMDTYAMLSRRMQYEDVLTIVDTYFMPYGLQSDQYQIMGTILFYANVRNSLTGEKLVQLTVECNGMTFDVCINREDLLGDPETGRRFKGNIWLQGRIAFQE